MGLGAGAAGLGSQPMDVAFHPAAPTICAAGLVSGAVEVCAWAPPAGGGEEVGAEGGPRVTVEFGCFSGGEACRAVQFAEGGAQLCAGSSGGALLLLDVDGGSEIARVPDVHAGEAVNKLEVAGPHLLATGGDDGQVLLWDVRALGPRPALRLSAHTDFVADFEWVEDRGRLLSVSGDGTLAVFDPRAAASSSGSAQNKHRQKRKGGAQKEVGVVARSEDDGGDELLSVAVLKGGRKVVCGSQSGVLHIFSWGYWNDCSDRFPGHPESVDAVVRWDDGTLLTGSSDGVVRAVSILPNKFVGVVGEHMDCPIERMALSGDGRLLATVSHDTQLKFWDLWESEKEGDGDGAEEGDGEEGGGGGRGRKRHRGKKNRAAPPGGHTGKRKGDASAAARAEFLSGLMD